MAQQSLVGQDLIMGALRSLSGKSRSLGLLGTSDKPETETST